MTFMPRRRPGELPGWLEFRPALPRPQSPFDVLEFGLGVLARALGGHTARNQFPSPSAGLPPSPGLPPKFPLSPPLPGYPGLLGNQPLGEPRGVGLLGIVDEDTAPSEASSLTPDVWLAEGGSPQLYAAVPAAAPRQPSPTIIDVEDLPEAGRKEKFAYPEIGNAEGNRPVANPRFPDAPTVAGIRQEELQALKDKIPGVTSDTKPQDLSLAQRAHFYRAYFDRELPYAFGHETFEQIDHTGTAAFVADTVFREGAKGNRTIQETINAIREMQRRRGMDVSDIKVDGRFGLETLYALNHIIQNGNDRQRFARELKVRRDEIHTDPRSWKGEAFRTQHFFELAVAKDQ